MKTIKDLTGQKFGRLTPLRWEKGYDLTTWWICQCDCGQEHFVRGTSLTNGDTKSCGCIGRGRKAKLKESIGQKFGRLTVLAFNTEQKGQSRFLCRCDCGTECIVRAGNIYNSSTKSCGCLRRERGRLPNEARAFSFQPSLF